MLQLRPNCECCDTDLPADTGDALICSFECTFCRNCAEQRFAGRCPNCSGDLVTRPTLPASLLQRDPANTERVLKAHDRGSRLSRPLNQPAARKLGGGLLVGCGLWLLDISRRPTATALNYSGGCLA